ncbi:hypothetical protein IM40_02635 [Candidatus Paracaedimonas acanthamoebae]|nr:hypothetical protein IM40_02635 [Candidatus Paracaedimonas acanthamoebae]
MRKDEIALTHEIYSEHLTKINGIDVSYREIDVIACLVASKTPGEIAQFLDIDKRTVSTHIKNIKKSFNLNSTKQIEATIRNSDKFELIQNKYLQSLCIRAKFESQLKKFSRIIKGEKTFCYEFNQQDKKNVSLLINQLKSHLKYAGISAREKTTQGYKPFYEIFPSVNEDTNYTLYLIAQGLTNDVIKIRHSISLESKNGTGEIILVQQKDSIPNDVPKQSHKAQQTLSLENENYYFAIFSVLRELYPYVNASQLTSDFKEALKKLSSLNENNSGIFNNVQHGFLKSFQPYKKWVFGGGVICVSIIAILACTLNDKKVGELSYNYQALGKKQIEKTWNLPASLDYYTERKELTAKIWSILSSSDSKQALVSLYGLGGVGKTTLATNIILNPQNNYTFRGWFSAGTEDLLKADYFLLGEKYHLFSKDMSDASKIRAVKEWLDTQSSSLLVYDNVPDIEMLKEFLPYKGHILITSTNYRLPKAIEVDSMTESEALKFVSKIIPKSFQEKSNYPYEIKKLIEMLGRLPLALSQASYYIYENKLSLTEYLKLYATRHDALLRLKCLPPGH